MLAAAAVLLMFGTASPVAARGLPQVSSAGQIAPPPGLRLAATPGLVDVGTYVTFSLTATSWPAAATATLTFVSPHHGFTGRMVWEPACSCFRISVDLARRIHPLENAKATAIVRYRGATFTTAAAFMVRGLARNGRDFAPGGTAHLTAWVSDPAPFQGEYEHFCGWVRTADGLGVAGYPVSFVAHFTDRTLSWVGGVTTTTGIVCSHKPIGKPAPGKAVIVDVYAGSLHYRTSFTPRP